MAVNGDLRWMQRGGTAVARLSGELDIGNAESLFAALRAGAGGDVDELVLDLSDVSFFDSTGAGQIVRLCEDYSLRIVAPARGKPRRVLSITQLDRVIPTFETLDEALAVTGDQRLA